MKTKNQIKKILLKYFEENCIAFQKFETNIYEHKCDLDVLEDHLETLAVQYFKIELRDIIFELRAIRGKYVKVK